MTQRGEEFAKLPAEPSPRLPGGRAGGHSWVPGTLSPRPPPRRGVGGGRTSPLPSPQPQLEAGCLDWVRLGCFGLFPLLLAASPYFLPPPFQMYNVNARKRSRKKGAENFLMRKGITSGGRRESEYVCGVSLTNSGRRLWGLKAEETPLASGQLGFPLCLPGPWGAWVPASWIWDSGVEVQGAPSQADPMEDLHRLSAPCPPPPNC